MIEAINTIDDVILALEEDREVKEQLRAIQNPKARDFYKALWLQVHLNDYTTEEERAKAFFDRFGYEKFQKSMVFFEALVRASKDAPRWFGRTGTVDGVDVEKGCKALNMSPDILAQILLSAAVHDPESSTADCEAALALLDQQALILFQTNMSSQRPQLREAAIVRWMRGSGGTAKKLQQLVEPEHLRGFSLISRNIIFWKVVGGPKRLVQNVQEQGTCDLADEYVRALDLPIHDAVHKAAVKLGTLDQLRGKQLKWQPTQTTWQFS